MPNPNSQNNNQDLPIPKKVVRTYSGDLAKSVQEKGGEAYRIARVEQNIKNREAKNTARQKKINLLFGLGGGLLILASLAALMYFSSKSNVKLNPEPVPAARPIIFYDSQKRIDVTGADQPKIVSLFRDEIEAPIAAGDIENIAFSENGRIVGLSRLLNLLKINPPPEMVKFLEQDYFAGIFGGSERNSPFLILRTGSYADISPYIITWENHMLDDLAPLLGIDISGERNYLVQNKFEDIIVSNKETRALRDKEGNIVLMYLFLDEKNILFALDKSALDEVLLRLYSPKR